MCDLRSFEMRIDAVILEALQRPLACTLHLGRTRQPRPDVVAQVFEILYQLGMSFNLVRNLLVRLFHGSAVTLLLIIAT